MAKHFKLHRIRIHQSYEVSEVSELLGASPQTVRKWIADGLPALNSTRPTLILGFELKSYLQAKQAKPERTHKLGELLCMSCGTHQMPLGSMADYIPQNGNSGRLDTLCGVCEGHCVSFTSPEKLAELSKVLQIIQMPIPEPNGTNQTTAKT